MNDTVKSPEPAAVPQRNAPVRFGVGRFSAVKLLVTLVLLFAATPFITELPGGDLVEVVLMTIVMVSAVLAVGGRRQTLLVAILLVAPALIAKWGNHVRPDLVPPEIFLAAGMIFFGFVVAQLLRFILRAPRVDANILCAGISSYLMLGLLWVPAYLVVARLSPTAFAITAGPDAGHALDNFGAFYFSFITLCTVGYGDIVPVSRPARMLAMMEAITGVFYMAVLISRLVAVYSSARPPAEEPSVPNRK